MNQFEKWILIIACAILGVAFPALCYMISATGRYK